jgi:DNA repair exonuclease SbcCD nuclease subunit
LQKFIDDAKKKVEGFNHDEIRIVITGDIVDQKINISNELILITAWFFREISKIGIVIIIPGNHDFLENNQERIDTITPIVELLDNKDIVYYKDSGVYEDKNIKWVVYSLYQDNQRPDFKEDEGSLYIGLFHGQVQGMSTDLGYKFEDGYDKLNFIGCDLVLCGDIHRRQVIELSNKRKAYMIGSFIQTEHGETIKHHGYGIYDVEENIYKFVDIESEQPFMHFKISDIKDIENETEVLVNLG